MAVGQKTSVVEKREREKSPITAKAQPEIYGEVDRTVFQFLE
jgi:hypothetical protein